MINVFKYREGILFFEDITYTVRPGTQVEKDL